MRTLRILIADDHAGVRRSIRTLLASHAEWDVSGEAADGQEAVDQARRLEPDVALLDITMPKLNGLEAARQIRRELPGTHILILTTNESEQLAQEARRAGAQGLISKSDAHETLIRAIEAIRESGTAVHLAGQIVSELRHIGAFFHSEEERCRILEPFINEGLAQGEKALHIIDPPDRGRHVRLLTKAGVDVDRAEARHQLQLLPWAEAYLREGEFDQEAMLKLLQKILTDGSAQGFPRTRVIAHMEWALENRPGVRDLVEYEARLNYVLPQFSDVVICAYDLTKFSGDVIIDVIRGHPAVMIDELLTDNPFYAPPDKIIKSLGKE
jgi:DNA-binding NarL/FixJ family response regulator